MPPPRTPANIDNCRANAAPDIDPLSASRLKLIQQQI
jgi:hypothetical protein